MITGGRRVTVDVVDVAATVFPPIAPAGTVLHALVLVQNTVNVPVDIVVQLSLPESDAAGHAGRITTPIVKPLRIGLLPGEVGYVSLPFTTEHRTEPGKGYEAQFNISAECVQQHAKPVRGPGNKTLADIRQLNETCQRQVSQLRTYSFSTQKAGKSALAATFGGLLGDKNSVVAPFEILPPAIAKFEPQQKAEYVSLWTEADIIDEARIIGNVRPLLDKLLPHMTHDRLLSPCLKATQAYFEHAHYPLDAVEALLVTKILLLAVEQSMPKTAPGTEPTGYPRWFTRLCRFLIRQPEAANPAVLEQLVLKELYPEFVFEGALLGFAILEPTLVHFHSLPADIPGYAKQLRAALTGGDRPLTTIRVYLPLILAGLAINARLVTPEENVRETYSAFAEAIGKRVDEQKFGTQFIFDIAESLLQQGLEHA